LRPVRPTEKPAKPERSPNGQGEPRSDPIGRKRSDPIGRKRSDPIGRKRSDPIGLKRSDPNRHTAARVYVFATIDHVVSPGVFGPTRRGAMPSRRALPRGPNAPRAEWSVI